MESAWKKDYSILTEYIKNNPSIIITATTVSIPEEVRGGFYDLFDGIRTGFIKENFPGLVDKGKTLSTTFAEASQAVSQKMGLGTIESDPSVKLFLLDAVDGLIRVLFEPLFDLLKRETELEGFEEKGKKLVDSAFRKWFRTGYVYWVQLALIMELDADKSYRVPVIDEISDNLMGEGHENVGQHKGLVPEAEESSKISFLQHPLTSFMTPKVILHSARLGKLVALHFDFVEPQWTAERVSREVEWYDFISLRQEHGVNRLRPDQKMPVELEKILPDVLVYSSGDFENIALVADHRRIMRPDMSIEIMEEPDWFEQGKLSSVKRHHAIMKPRCGTFIICREPPPQAALDALAPKPLPAVHPHDEPIAPEVRTTAPENPKQPEPEPAFEPPLDIHIIGIGYDMRRLEPLVEALNKVKLCA